MRRANPTCALVRIPFSRRRDLNAIGVSLIARRWETPAWLTRSAPGSIAFLYALGLLNLYSVFAALLGEIVAPAGLKGRLLSCFVSQPLALCSPVLDTVSRGTVSTASACRAGFPSCWALPSC
jgi:hypothetical protein